MIMMIIIIIIIIMVVVNRGKDKSFERDTVRKLHAGLAGGPNLDSVRLTVEEKTLLHTCSDLSKPVRTCPNLSTIQ